MYSPTINSFELYLWNTDTQGNVTGFLFDVSTDPDFNNILPFYQNKIVSPNITNGIISGYTEIITGLSPSTLYQVRAKSINSFGFSNFYDWRNVRTLFDVYNNHWELSQTLTGLNSSTTDNFGYDIAVNKQGTILTVSDPPEQEGGVIYVYTGSNVSPWSLKQILSGNNIGTFGRSVSMNYDGSKIAVGCPKYWVNSVSQVYIFTGNAVNGWNIQQVISGYSSPNNDNRDRFGETVKINDFGNILAFSENQSDGALGLDGLIVTGNIRIYKETNNVWNLSQIIQHPTGFISHSNNFGHEISMSAYGDQILVSAPRYQYTTSSVLMRKAGQVFLFTGNATTDWVFSKSFPTYMDDYIPIWGDSFYGTDVNLTSVGNRMFIGSPFRRRQLTAGDVSIRSGDVEIYQLNSNNIWELYSDNPFIPIPGNRTTGSFNTSDLTSGALWGRKIVTDSNGFTYGISAPRFERSGVNINSNAGAVFIYSNYNDSLYKIIDRGVAGENFGYPFEANKNFSTLFIGNISGSSANKSIYIYTGNNFGPYHVSPSTFNFNANNISSPQPPGFSILLGGLNVVSNSPYFASGRSSLPNFGSSYIGQSFNPNGRQVNFVLTSPVKMFDTLSFDCNYFWNGGTRDITLRTVRERVNSFDSPLRDDFLVIRHGPNTDTLNLASSSNNWSPIVITGNAYNKTFNFRFEHSGEFVLFKVRPSGISNDIFQQNIPISGRMISRLAFVQALVPDGSNINYDLLFNNISIN